MSSERQRQIMHAYVHSDGTIAPIAMDHRALLQKISLRSATVVVMGLGYVGLSLAIEVTEAGFDVMGYDVSDEKCALLNQSTS
jgi:phosphoglycerate dehydrogenase-like enzyme